MKKGQKSQKGSDPNWHIFGWTLQRFGGKCGAGLPLRRYIMCFNYE